MANQTNQTSNKKPNIFKRMGTALSKSWSELKKVSWPTFREVVKNTLVVLAVVIFFVLIVGGADWIFAKLLGLLTGIGGKA